MTSDLSLRRFSDSPVTAPAVDAWVLRRIGGGWSAQAVRAATGNAISLRTAYRWIADFVRIEDIRVGDHEAAFAIRRGKSPIRIEPWRKVS